MDAYVDKLLNNNTKKLTISKRANFSLKSLIRNFSFLDFLDFIIHFCNESKELQQINEKVSRNTYV